MNTTLEAILKDIGLHPTSSKIYRELLEHGEVPARLLAERLSITRPSTYDHLELLKNKGLVAERKVGNTTLFSVSDVTAIKHTLKEKIETLHTHEKAFATLLPELLKQTTQNAPTIKFFEGIPGLKHLLYDTLWNKGEVIYTMWPHEEIEHILGKDFLIQFNEKRIREKIEVYALWPHSMKPKDGYIWKNKDILTKRKYAPKGSTWSMGYSIYGDKVSFISSHKEVFGFIVQSREFAQLMTLQFNCMWLQAKEK